VTRHHLILKAFPKELYRLLWIAAFKRVKILNDNIIIGGPLDLQTKDALHLSTFLHATLVCVGVQEIVYFLIVELDIGARNCDFLLTMRLLSHFFNLRE
jgi:hypothetical protein